jgi:NADPH-dependent F420 reductase
MEDDMKIAVIGAGNVGSTLGMRWAAVGHEVVFGVRDPRNAKHAALVSQPGGKVRLATIAEAVAPADVVLLATPWDASGAAITACANLAGKALIDATNPLTADLSLAVGLHDSGGEQVARWAKGAHVVKAFNTTGFNIMADPVMEGRPAVMFVAGDDPAAKVTVQGLAKAIGFEPVDAGPLKMARHLESMAVLWISCAYRQGLGRDYAFALIRKQARS